MMEYWQPIHTRGQETIAVWGQHAPAFTVGQLTLATHTSNTALILTHVTERDTQEDVFDAAVNARDTNFALLRDLNVRAPQTIEGNLEEGDMMLREVGDIYAVKNDSMPNVTERARKLVSLWNMVNTARAAATPALPALLVGDLAVADLEDALENHPVLLQAVEDQDAIFSKKKSQLRKTANRVDTDNKRWYKAWSGNFAEGSAELDALSQVSTESSPPPAVGQAVISQAVYIAIGQKVHLDFDAEHATSFKVRRQSPGESQPSVIAESVPTTSFDDTDAPTGNNIYTVLGHNSAGDGPASDAATVAVP